MKEANEINTPVWIKWIHLGLAVFGILAYLTGELAEHSNSFGYLLHAYLGLTLLFVLLCRFFYGFWGQRGYRFSNWFPYKKSYLATLKEDINDLIRLKFPKRQDHRGFAGLVQAFGLVIFAWMAVTGTIMFVTNVTDDSILSELHEVGEGLIPLFLGLHLGAVALHMLSGHNLVSRMIPFRHNEKESTT
ncbi:MAG: cytochrome b/b6 domain-containing protein [Gammaproteobacteria bacterium]